MTKYICKAEKTKKNTYIIALDCFLHSANIFQSITLRKQRQYYRIASNKIAHLESGFYFRVLFAVLITKIALCFISYFQSFVWKTMKKNNILMYKKNKKNYLLQSLKVKEKKNKVAIL
jgi:hypothetical protein